MALLAMFPSSDSRFRKSQSHALLRAFMRGTSSTTPTSPRYWLWTDQIKWPSWPPCELGRRNCHGSNALRCTARWPNEDGHWPPWCLSGVRGTPWIERRSYGGLFGVRWGAPLWIERRRRGGLHAKSKAVPNTALQSGVSPVRSKAVPNTALQSCRRLVICAGRCGL